MTARGGIAIVSTVVAMAVAATVVASTSAETARERPRGVVEDCSTAPGWPGGSAREFTSRWNRVVGPLALEGAGVMLAYADSAGGNKLLVHVRGGHRVTLELSRQTRMDVGFAFGAPLGATRASKWNLRNTRRVVTFRACQRGERSELFDDYDEWPVTAWVGFLLASSPRCVPLLVWVDDEPSPRRTVIRFGVSNCD
jgi:hypothetical protein